MSADTALPPLISAQLKHLLTHFDPPVKVDQVWSGCKNPSYNDRFTLLIPICLDYIKWDIIYNALHPLAAPDIVFSAEDESFHPLSLVVDREGDGEVRRKAESSLCDWNYKDPTRLLALVREIRDLYLDYQRKRVGELGDARLKFEMSTIPSREGIEVCLMTGSDRTEEVKFVVPLLDIDQLIREFPWKTQQKVYLQDAPCVQGIVRHLLGGGTVALLTYILRKRKEFSPSTCVTFARAACMTWDLVEPGKHFITTVINGSDLVPTFSTTSIDNLRSEVAASSWLNDQREQVQNTKILNVVYRSAYALGSRLPSISNARAMRSAQTVAQDIAKAIVDADAVSHGCTGKGNDQKSIYSRDRNLWHLSHEGDSFRDRKYEIKLKAFFLFGLLASIRSLPPLHLRPSF